jgi:thymidine kinase
MKNNKLKVFTGPMFSGKTTTLVGDLTEYVSLGISVLFIGSTVDTRSDGSASPHSESISLPNSIPSIKVKQLLDANITNAEVIGVDEAQFFDDLEAAVKQWLSLGKEIIIAGLDTDFNMKPFGQISKLVHIANEYIKLHAKCSECFEESGEICNGDFSFRKCNVDDTILVSESQNDYIPVCRQHYNKLTLKRWYSKRCTNVEKMTIKQALGEACDPSAIKQIDLHYGNKIIPAMFNDSYAVLLIESEPDKYMLAIYDSRKYSELYLGTDRFTDETYTITHVSKNGTIGNELKKPLSIKGGNLNGVPTFTIIE